MTAIIQTVLLAAVVVYCALEQLGARRWRRNALEVQEKQFKAALATWARVAGKTRLEDPAGNRGNAILAPGQRQDAAGEETEFEQLVTHARILNGAADRA